LEFKKKGKLQRDIVRKQRSNKDKFSLYGNLNAVEEVGDIGEGFLDKIKIFLILKLIKSCGEKAFKKLTLYNMQDSGCSNETLFKTYI
jgi:hypothetical protein